MSLPFDQPPPPPVFRRVLLLAAVAVTVAAGGIAADRLFRSTGPVPVDFAAFWTAGRLNARGENPYDPTTVRAVQRALAVRSDVAVMMWNPPWVLTLVMPFGLLPAGPAYGLWALVHVGLVLVAAELLWREFAPAAAGAGAAHRARRWVAYVVALTFVPTTYLIGIGQLTAVVLAGLAGFFVLARAGRPALAGAVGAVTAAKPHLLTVFAAWLVLEAAAGRAGRRVLLGGAAVGLGACLVPTLTNPGVWADYRAALSAPADAEHYHLSNWATPVVASWVRRALPGQPFWVQFVAPAAAVAGFAAWYRAGGRGPSGPDWARLLPAVVGLSLLTAPYGAWPFDLVLLLVPVLAAAARVAAGPTPAAVGVGVGGLIAVNAALLVMMLNCVSSEWYVWVTPVVLAGCLSAVRLAERPAHVAGPSFAPAGA